MTKKRARKICRIYAGLSRGLYKLIEYADGSTGVIEIGVGVVECWSKQYLERVIIPLTTSGAGLVCIMAEGIKQDTEALAWQGEYMGEAFSFAPFEVVEIPTGKAVFLAYANENRSIAMVEKGGTTLNLPTKYLSKLKN